MREIFWYSEAQTSLGVSARKRNLGNLAVRQCVHTAVCVGAARIFLAGQHQQRRRARADEGNRDDELIDGKVAAPDLEIGSGRFTGLITDRTDDLDIVGESRRQKGRGDTSDKALLVEAFGRDHRTISAGDLRGAKGNCENGQERGRCRCVPGCSNHHGSLQIRVGARLTARISLLVVSALILSRPQPVHDIKIEIHSSFYAPHLVWGMCLRGTQRRPV